MKENLNEVEKVEKVAEGQELSIIKGLGEMQKRTNTKADIFTNITDNKKIFNLENKVDVLLNDIPNQEILVKEVLIKRYEKPMKNPVVDEETGEVIKDKEISMATILIDENGTSYATGSKIFGIQLMRCIEMFGLDEEEGLLIKIVKNSVNGHQSLGFELV